MKLSEALGMTRGHTLITKSAAVFVGDLRKVYKMTKELVNANTKADLSVLDLNGNIVSTDEEKLNRWSEHFQSVLNHVVSRDVSPFVPTTETISPDSLCHQIYSSGKAAEIDGIPAEFYK